MVFSCRPDRALDLRFCEAQGILLSPPALDRAQHRLSAEPAIIRCSRPSARRSPDPRQGPDETILPRHETIFGSRRNRPETVTRPFCAQGYAEKATGELQMNHSIYSADRSTHRKIVIVALVAGIAVAGFGISARTTSDRSE